MPHANNYLSLSLWHKNNQIRELAGRLLCCWKQWKQLYRSSSSVTKNTFSPSSVDQFLLLTFLASKQPTSPYGFDFPFIFSWLLSVWSCNRNDGMIKVSILWHFLDENMQNIMNSPCFWPQITFPASYLQWRWRDRETRVGRVKITPLFFPVPANLEVCALHK